MSGFEKPNYTQTPNAIFDELMADMGNAELRVVLAISRKTFGWHKERDVISLSQLEKMTGLARDSVVSGIQRAIERGVVRRTKSGNSYAYELIVGLPNHREHIDSRATQPEIVGLPNTQKKEIKQKKPISPYRAEETPAWLTNEIMARARESS